MFMSSVIYQKQRTQRFFLDLSIRMMHVFTKKSPLSVQITLLPKKDNVYQIHACSLQLYS